jgi:hypothetical protein
LAEETEVLGQNLPQCHSEHEKCHITSPRVETGQPWRRKIKYKKKQKEIGQRKKILREDTGGNGKLDSQQMERQRQRR